MYVNPSKMIGVLAKLLKEIFNCSPVLVAAFPIHYKVQTQCKEFPIKIIIIINGKNWLRHILLSYPKFANRSTW